MINTVDFMQTIQMTTASLVENPTDFILEMLYSNFKYVCLAFAIYSAMNSIIKITTTPSVCSSHPFDSVFVARKRIFVLHSFNLAIRYGFCTVWLLSKQIYMLKPGVTSLSGYLRAFDYTSLLTTPLEIAILGKAVNFNAMANNNYFQGIILFDVLFMMFDFGLSSDFWITLVQSSSIPAKIKDVPLSMVYPYADMISKCISASVDFVVSVTIAYFSMQFKVLQRDIFDRVPDGCDKGFIHFIVMYHIASAAVRIICKGGSIGRFLVGVDVIKGDGSPLSLLTLLEREIYAFGFSSSFVSPFVIMATEEGASLVDLITNTREVDVMRHPDKILTLDGADTEVSFPEYDGSKYYVAPTVTKTEPSKASNKTPSTKVTKKAASSKPPIQLTPNTSDKKPPSSSSKSTKKRDRDDASPATSKSAKKSTKTPTKTPTTKRKADFEQVMELYTATKSKKSKQVE